MNYLAHAYLSFDHQEILVGNLISDFVKGKQKSAYPSGIQRGISLHRSIDAFTDSHTATKEAKQVFRSAYRLYSGAFIDIVYDHFLANDKNEFSESTLFEFSNRVYGIVEKNISVVPSSFARMFSFMKKQNWLYEYRTIQGIEKGFAGLVRRAVYINESETASRLFESHYQLLNDCYRQFWKDVKPFALDTFQSLLNSSTADPTL
ncbi:MAG TPA: ACP phosphodiesterase [Chitinophagaceae bacterium]|nr:ACP phosphodiesterase [Chitinophagaceae bacterium]